MTLQETVVEAGGGFRQYWRDLWRFRELVLILGWRDLSVRYKQTVLGVAWSALRPILTTVVFTIIFGRLAQFPSHGVPYPILVLSGLIGWQFFAAALEASSSSVISSANLVGKVYFPRLVIPLSSMAVSLVDLAINVIILSGLMVWFQYMPPLRVLFAPLFLVCAGLLTLGLGFWFSALSAQYRDFRVIVPFVLQFGFYISPVGFSATVVPAAWQSVYALNPMVGIIEGMRWSLIATANPPSIFALSVSFSITLFAFATGALFFRRMERRFADVL